MLSTSKKPWNKGKAIGQKKPLTPNQVHLIKQILDAEGNLRDLALFSTAIDTMLRGIDLLSLTVDDVMTYDGLIKEELLIMQKKTNKGTLVALSNKTQKVLLRWIKDSMKTRYDYIFTGIRKGKDQSISTKQYRRLVKKWVGYARLESKEYSSHSLRRTKASLVFELTGGNHEVVRQLLGQSTIASTSTYLNVDGKQALEIAKGIEL
jgi:integrase